jgi:hypothetical protein
MATICVYLGSIIGKEHMHRASHVCKAFTWDSIHFDKSRCFYNSGEYTYFDQGATLQIWWD